MTRQQFIFMAIFTAIETYFFNESLATGNYLLAAFCGFLIARNLWISYLMGRLANEIDKHFGQK